MCCRKSVLTDFLKISIGHRSTPLITPLREWYVMPIRTPLPFPYRPNVCMEPENPRGSRFPVQAGRDYGNAQLVNRAGTYGKTDPSTDFPIFSVYLIQTSKTFVAPPKKRGNFLLFSPFFHDFIQTWFGFLIFCNPPASSYWQGKTPESTGKREKIVKQPVTGGKTRQWGGIGRPRGGQGRERVGRKKLFSSSVWVCPIRRLNSTFSQLFFAPYSYCVLNRELSHIFWSFPYSPRFFFTTTVTAIHKTEKNICSRSSRKANRSSKSPPPNLPWKRENRGILPISFVFHCCPIQPIMHFCLYKRMPKKIQRCEFNARKKSRFALHCALQIYYSGKFFASHRHPWWRHHDACVYVAYGHRRSH